MKLLLTAINAKYIHSNLAVYSLRAYAKENQESIELAEYTINHKKEAILRELYRREPDVLFFSCYIWNYEYVKTLAAEFHKLRSEVPIWVGGPEVSYEIEAMFRENPAFFGVMIGEGEETFAKLADYYCKGKAGDLSEISGIAFRKGGYRAGEDILQTKPAEALSLSDLPFPYADMDCFRNRIVYYESSRGCPFSCSYCLSSIDKHLRFRDLRLVKEELSFFLNQKVPQVKFVDRTFNCSHTHAMEIWRFLKEHDNGITNFHFEIAADLLTEEEFLLLKGLRPGFFQFEIGVQSTNRRTIEEIRRKTDLPTVTSAVKRLQEAGNIHIHLDLIAGLPFEDYESFQKSFREVYALKPQQLQLGFLKVLKGSYLYERREAYGILFWEEPPYEVLQTNWLTFGEILKIKLVEEMLEVYYNSGQFEVTMKLLDAAYDDPFCFFLRLGEFYEAMGYRGESFTRIKRAGILLDFLMKEQKMPRELIEESLLFDLYYRENMKSRPAWAGSPAEFAKITKVFCKNRTQSHIEPFSYHFPQKEERTVRGLPKRLSERIYVLFEYETRDALTHQAKVTEFTKQEVEKAWENAQMKF